MEIQPSFDNEPDVAFDQDKFIAAVHYIIHARTGDPASLGKTKLHKTLYYADMLSYVDTRKPVTGVEYIKQPFGPFARYLKWALDTLRLAQAISITKTNFFGLEKFDFLSLRAPQTNLLSDYDKRLLDETIEFVCGFSAKEISEISHAAPWKIVRTGERISYASAFLLLPPRAPLKRDVEWADEMAAALPPLSA